MPAPEKIEKAPGKTCRSCLHHSITPALPFKSTAEGRFDFLGGVMMVGVAGIMLALMRLLLAD